MNFVDVVKQRSNLNLKNYQSIYYCCPKQQRPCLLFVQTRTRKHKKSVACVYHRWTWFKEIKVLLCTNTMGSSSHNRTLSCNAETKDFACPCLANKKQQRPDSWRGCLHINHLSYPRFLTLFIEWYAFLVLITWLVKTEKTTPLSIICIYALLEFSMFCITLNCIYR